MNWMANRLLLTGFFICALCGRLGAQEVDPRVDFETQIAPILERYCVRCHGPGNAKGDVSLETIADLREKEYVVAGDPDASYLVELISAVDGKPPKMPQEGDRLTANQLSLIRSWIAQGALWPDDVIIRVKSKADAS